MSTVFSTFFDGLSAEGEEPPLFTGFTGNAPHRIARAVDGAPQGVLVQGLLGEDDRLLFGVGGGDLFDREGLADGIVHMGLTHAAGHAVHLEGVLGHLRRFLSASYISLS